MKMLFIDDSRSEEGGYFVTGGICVSEDQIKRFDEKFIDIKKGIKSIPSKLIWVEVKWATRKFWEGPPLKMFELEKIRNSVLEFIRNSNAILFGGMLDTNYYKNFSRAYWYINSLEVLCTKFQYYLQETNEQGIVIADHLGSHKEDKIARGELARIHREGAKWAKLDRVLLNPILYHSYTIPCMHYADFVAGALNFRINRNLPKYYNIIEPRFRRDTKTGKLEGFGISFIPSNRKPSNW